MVPGDNQDGGRELEDFGEPLIEFLDDGDLAGKITVFPVRIGFFDVQEKEIVFAIMPFQAGDLVLDGAAGFQDIHAHQPGQPLVHGIYRDSGRLQLEQLGHGRNGRVLGEAPQQAGIGREGTGQFGGQAVNELIDDAGGLGGGFALGPGMEDRPADGFR